MAPEPELELQLLNALVAGVVVVEGDLVEVREGLWAVHGFVTYDGEILLQEFDSLAQAQWVLDHVPHPSSPHDGGTPTRPADHPSWPADAR